MVKLEGGTAALEFWHHELENEDNGSGLDSVYQQWRQFITGEMSRTQKELQHKQLSYNDKAKFVELYLEWISA